MLADQLRQAVDACPRSGLPQVQDTLWKAWAQGLLEDDEAQALSEIIATRRALPAVPRPRITVPRPRPRERVERHRRWAASGWLPPSIAARFTVSEQSCLAVLAQE